MKTKLTNLAFVLVVSSLVELAAQAAVLGQVAAANSLAITTNTIIIAAIGLVSTAISSITAILVARVGTNTKVTAEASKTTADTVQKTDEKTDSLIKQTQEIHTLTNSNLSNVTKALELSQKETQGLKDIIAQMSIQISETNKTLSRLRQEKDGNTATDRTADVLKESVKEAVVESVKAPVKEAVQESVFTPGQINQIIKALQATP